MKIIKAVCILAWLSAAVVTRADILDAPPADPDPGAHYLIYLHGGIVTGSDGRPVSEYFGVYEYRDILDTLASAGFTVISEIRADDSDIDAAARRIAGWISQLRAGGVPATRIAVIGASMGGIIAGRVSHTVPDPDITYVLIASTYSMGSIPPVSLHGRVLVIYDASDERYWVEQAYFGLSPDLTGHATIVTHTGLGHGLLFTVQPAWTVPALAWIRGESVSDSR